MIAISLQMIHTDLKPENFLLGQRTPFVVGRVQAERKLAVAEENRRRKAEETQHHEERRRRELEVMAALKRSREAPRGGGAGAAGATGDSTLKLSKNQKRRLRQKLKKQQQPQQRQPSSTSTEVCDSASPRGDTAPSAEATDLTVRTVAPATKPSVAASDSSATAPFADGKSSVAEPKSAATSAVPEAESGRVVTGVPSTAVLGGGHVGEEKVLCKIADMGNACRTRKHYTDDVTTRQYRAPEIIVRGRYSTPIDMWSFACIVFELLTGDYLFDPKNDKHREHSRDEGIPNDPGPNALRSNPPCHRVDARLLMRCMFSLDHLALMIELLGPMPKQLTSRGERSKRYFDKRGELRNIKNLTPYVPNPYPSLTSPRDDSLIVRRLRVRRWTLEEVLHQKYRFSTAESLEIASFLLPMLNYNPTRRATAKEMLQHSWLVPKLVETDEPSPAPRSPRIPSSNPDAELHSADPLASPSADQPQTASADHREAHNADQQSALPAADHQSALPAADQQSALPATSDSLLTPLHRETPDPPLAFPI